MENEILQKEVEVFDYFLTYCHYMQGAYSLQNSESGFL